MIPEAAQLAVDIAIDTSPVSAVCCPSNDSDYQIKVARAGLGAMITETEGTDGRMVRVNHSDARSLIVFPDDLKIGNFKYEPRHGDAWTITLPSGHKIHGECAPFDNKHFRWTDRFQTAYRIFIKIFDD